MRRRCASAAISRDSESRFRASFRVLWVSDSCKTEDVDFVPAPTSEGAATRAARPPKRSSRATR